MPSGHPAISPANANLFSLITADIAVHRQSPALAYELLMQTVKRTQSAEVAQRAWHAAVLTRDTKKVLEAANTWIALDPENETPHQTLLANAVDKGDRKTFLQELAVMYRLTKDKPAWVTRITVMLTRPNLDAALIEKGLTPYWEKESRNADVQIAIGLFYQATNNDAAACRAAKRAVTQNQKDEQIVATAADLCWRSNQRAAQDIVEGFLSKSPDSAAVRLIYSRILSRTDRVPQAISEMKRAVNTAPDDPNILLNAGQLAGDYQAWPLAEDYLTRYLSAAEEQEPDADLSGSEVHLRLASVLHNNNRHLQEARQLSRLTSGTLAPEARLREAAALAEIGRLNEARELLVKARESFPDKWQAFLTAEAQLLGENNRKAEALALLEESLSKAPDNAALMYDAAMCAENLGEHERAEKYLRSILAMNADHVQANNALGYILLLQDNRKEEARRFLEHAYRLAPLDPFVLDSMGWLSFKDGSYDEAAEFTLTSLKKHFDIEVACHLVEILIYADRRTEAESLFSQLLRRAADDSRVQTLGTRLKLLPSPEKGPLQ